MDEWMTGGFGEGWNIRVHVHVRTCFFFLFFLGSCEDHNRINQVECYPWIYTHMPRHQSAIVNKHAVEDSIKKISAMKTIGYYS